MLSTAAIVTALITGIPALIVLFLRFGSNHWSKVQKPPGLAFKLYLFASILIGQTLITFSANEINPPWDAVLALTVMVWNAMSLLVTFSVSTRWCIYPIAYIFSCICFLVYSLSTVKTAGLPDELKHALISQQNMATLIFGSIVTIGAVFTLVRAGIAKARQAME